MNECLSFSREPAGTALKIKLVVLSHFERETALKDFLMGSMFDLYKVLRCLYKHLY